MTYDVREIANFVLDVADKQGALVTNLSLNKIIYFLHASYLVKYRKPLVSAKIEAWKFGPVFREIYRFYKDCGDKPITFQSTRISPVSGANEICSWKLNADEIRVLGPLAEKYLKMESHELVRLSHVKGGPWDQVWNHASLSQASMRITDESILNYYNEVVRH